MDSEKFEMTVQVADAAPPRDLRGPVESVEKQTRTRRLFTPAQLFSFSFMYFVTWQAMGTNMYFALVNGGPAAYLFNFILIAIGVLAQAACLAECASILPMAGAQYYWTFYFATPKYKLFLTWMQGWATWMGYVSCLASSLNNSAVVLKATIQIHYPDYENGGWHTTLMVMAALLFLTTVNVWFFRAVPWFELAAGLLNICFFFITVVVLWIMSPRNDPSFMLITSNVAGWDNFISWNVGMLTQVWMFIGFESVTHMGEEAKDATRSAPRAMFWSIVANQVLGLFMVITYIITMPPLEDMLNASNPFVYLVVTSTGSPAVATVIAAGVVITGFFCAMSVFSSTTRITWAWARDGGLPSLFGHVDSKTRVPQRAVLLTCTIVTLLSLLNIGADTYVALGAVTSLSSLAIYFSYAVVLSVILHARLTMGMPVSAWSTGRLGTPLNVFALVYTLYVMVWLPFPTAVPVTAVSMNYCGPIFLTVILGAVGAWVVWAGRHWAGPNQSVAKVVLERARES
ncbi:amino acid permease [Microdochium trichocladiopsis]|uniref:Amino acid permease n=1 Tax=Microdochium trichocladiopsis TaxID=1682393 RepID=A0A9P8XSR8_9PEZI|nr:amino acid permease [Microdochium trichocladiopsis]KAH7014576.1 amino acid permease [Microdochium trichocladiopsis]